MQWVSLLDKNLKIDQESELLDFVSQKYRLVSASVCPGGEVVGGGGVDQNKHSLKLLIHL